MCHVAYPISRRSVTSSGRPNGADPSYVYVAEQSRSGDMREKPAGHPGVPSVAGRISTASTLHWTATAAATAATRGATTRLAAALLRDGPAARRRRGQQRRASSSTGIAGHRYGTSLPRRRLYSHRDDDGLVVGIGISVG